MSLIKGTQTEKNVVISFAYESTARNRYSFYAKKAHEERYFEAAEIFDLTAKQEHMHGEKFYELLDGGIVAAAGDKFIAGDIGTTAQNLAFAAAQEKMEFSEIYPQFAQIAEEENFPVVAELYRNICVAEEAHKKRFDYFLKYFQDRDVFECKEPVLWQCQRCGYVHNGRTAPDICPLCMQSRGNFYVVNRLID